MVSKQVRDDVKRATAENKRLLEQREKLQSHLMDLKKKTKELKLEKNLLIDLLMKKQGNSGKKKKQTGTATQNGNNVGEEDELQHSSAEEIALLD